MSANTGGTAFPLPDRYAAEGMTLLDWYAGQETIGDEDLMMPICEHFAGPKPAGEWKTNPVEWYEWEARWRAGVKYMRASAMLAERARREATGKRDLQVEAVVKESSTTGHSEDLLGKVAELEAANRELVEALELAERTFSSTQYDRGQTRRTIRTILAKHKGAA